MKPTSWIITTFVLTLFGLFIVGVANFMLDPFQQYAKATKHKPIYDNERYLNSGLAKTYDYKQVIIGSSMTENFLLSDVKEVLGLDKPIKFCMSGATSYEMKVTLEHAYRQRKIDTVIYGLDLFSFTGNTTRLFGGAGTFPFYLYDNNYLNDYRYLVSFDTLKFFVDSFILPKPAQMFDFNRMYEWQYRLSEGDFNKKDRIDEWKEKYGFNPDYSKSEYALKAMKENVDINLLPMIQNHPETTFYIFYPPYSILAFKDMQTKGWLSTVEQFKHYVYLELAHYPNVKLYDFQASKEVTCNLDNYKDLLHYHQRINTWMLQQMRDEGYLTKNNAQFKQSTRALGKNIQQCGYN